MTTAIKSWTARGFKDSNYHFSDQKKILVVWKLIVRLEICQKSDNFNACENYPVETLSYSENMAILASSQSSQVFVCLSVIVFICVWIIEVNENAVNTWIELENIVNVQNQGKSKGR